MSMKKIYPASMDRQSIGQLQVDVRANQGAAPIENATVSIKAGTEATEAIEVLQTDISGKTETVELPAPPVELTQEPNAEEQPWSNYTVEVTSPTYEPVIVDGVQVFADSEALQYVDLSPEPEVTSQQVQIITIVPHSLFVQYPPKIPEASVKVIPPGDSGFIVLDEVVVPEFIIVHDGVPDDSTAPNYYIRFRDYIKNVASSEIYSTWPEATMTANILAILSFTLNRVFTEWYRNQGKNFTITSSTAYDHQFIYGRNFYRSISEIVDQIFTNYLSRPGVKQPILTQYCDGVQVTCPGWMTQWGSKYLGDQGQSAIEILRYYYGSDMYINTAPQVAGIPSSFPGYNLQTGSSGPSVRTIQRQLNAISNNFPAIPKVAVDGVYGASTRDAVETFQRVFNMPVTGIVDYPTWYRISDIYVAVTRMAELV